jgi:hypothetical protein
MVHNVKLITLSEDSIAFREQERLLGKYATDCNHEHLIRLALLINNPPIADYNSAIQLLSNLCEHTLDEKALVIGAYISVSHTGSISESFRAFISDNVDMMTSDYQSACYYVLALEMICRDKLGEARYFLTKAIEKKEDCVLAYFQLAKLCDSNKEYLLEVAKSHILVLQNTDCIGMLSCEELLCPQAYIQEHIFGTIMTEEIIDFWLS